MLAFSNHLKEHAPEQYNAIKDIAVTDPNYRLKLAKLAINYILFSPCKKTREELYELERKTRKLFHCRSCLLCNVPDISVLSLIRYNHINKDTELEDSFGVENIAMKENIEVLKQTFCSCKSLSQKSLYEYCMGHTTLQKKKEMLKNK